VRIRFRNPRPVISAVISAYAKDQYSEYYPQEMGAEEIIYAEYGRNMLGS
jgi:hypothetical protein